MKYTIEIHEWDFLLGEGKPKITKKEHESNEQLWNEDLKPIGVQKVLEHYAGEPLPLAEITFWERYARETCELSWKVGRAMYEGEAQYWNMAVGADYTSDPATFYTIYTYPTPKEEQ